MFWFSKAILRVAGVLLETRGIIPEQAIEKGLNRHRAKYIFFRFVSLFLFSNLNQQMIGTIELMDQNNT